MKHKKILKILVLLLLLCGIADCIFQKVTISVASEEKKITYVDTVNDTAYTILKKEIPKIEQPVEQLDQDIINKENSNNETTRSQDINEREIIVNNSITIPNVCTNALLSVGSTQEAVDTNDICIMTEANNSNFGDNKVRQILLGGHNTKSLKRLYNANINDVITVRYNSVNYTYKIIYSNECTSDGKRLYDIDTGINMLDFSYEQESIYIYTCYGQNNWLVKAIEI